MKMLKRFISKRRKKKDDATNANLKAMNAHLIALARLSFIKPKDLVREARNAKANTDYLYQMIEEGENEKKNTT
jgi:hypothetical protein